MSAKSPYRPTDIRHLACTDREARRQKHMAEPNEDEIRTYAHQLWDKAGRSEGRDKEVLGIGPTRVAESEQIFSGAPLITSR